MKKTVASITILVMLIAIAIFAGTVPEASGEGITFHRILPVEQDWVHSEGAPTLAVASDDYTIVFVDGAIVAIPTSDGSKRTITSCNGKTPVSAFTYGQYLFVKYANTPALSIYSLPTLEQNVTEILVSHIAGAGSTLFLAIYRQETGLMDVRQYDLTQDVALDFSQPISQMNFFTCEGVFETQLEPSSLKAMAVSDEAIYYVTASGDISALFFSGQRSTFLMNDKNYDSVAVYGNYVIGVDKKAGSVRMVNANTGNDVRLPDGDEDEQKITLPTSVSASNGLFYVCDDHSLSVNVFEVGQDEQGEILTHVRSIAGKGAASGRLNSPSDIFCCDKIYVADTENNRILIKNGDKVNTITGLNQPHSITVWNDAVCVADADGIKVVKTANSATLISNLENVAMISATKDGLFAVVNGEDSGTVYKLSKDENNTISESVFLELDEPIVELTSHRNGSSVVVMTRSDLTVCYDAGAELFTMPLGLLGVSHDGEDNVLLSARMTVRGDLYMLLSNSGTISLLRATRLLDSFERAATMPLPENFTDFAIMDDGVFYFTEKNSHSLFEMRGSYASMTGTTVAPPTDYLDDEALTTEAFIFRTTEDCYMYASPDNFETIIPVEAGEQLLGLSNTGIHVNGSAFYYVMRDGVPGYIVSTAVESMPAGSVPASQYRYVNKNHTDILYKYPIEDERFALVTLSRHTELLPTTTVSGYDDNSWYSVQYEGSIYYVRRVHIDIANPPAPTVYYYANIKAEAIGTTVNVYTLQDVYSDVKGVLTDGVEVKLVAPFNPANTYTYVVCGDIEGYVLTANIITGGLTSAQVTGIVLICMAGATSTAIFAISRKLKSRKE